MIWTYKIIEFNKGVAKVAYNSGRDEILDGLFIVDNFNRADIIKISKTSDELDTMRIMAKIPGKVFGFKHSKGYVTENEIGKCYHIICS